MDQSVVNLALSAVLATIGWFARQLWGASSKADAKAKAKGISARLKGKK